VAPVARDESSMPPPIATEPDLSVRGLHGGDSALPAGTRTVYSEVGPASSGPTSGHIYSRPPTSSGGRNQQDSSFSLSAMSDSMYTL